MVKPSLTMGNGLESILGMSFPIDIVHFFFLLTIGVIISDFEGIQIHIHRSKPNIKLIKLLLKV